MSDQRNHTHTPGDDDESDATDGSTPNETQKLLDEETTDENGMPLENPSGG